MVSPRKEYNLVEKAAKSLGKNNGALNTKMAMRATGMADDDTGNISLQKFVQRRYKELNAGKVTLSVNASSAKYPPPMSPLTISRTDVSSTTSHTKISISGIKRKHPPLTKKTVNNLLTSNRFMRAEISKHRLIMELLRKLQ